MSQNSSGSAVNTISLRDLLPNFVIVSDLYGNTTFEDSSLCHQLKKLYFFNYLEYLVTSFLNSFCCCCKRRQCVKRRVDKLKRHKDASKKLKNEIDIV